MIIIDSGEKPYVFEAFEEKGKDATITVLHQGAYPLPPNYK